MYATYYPEMSPQLDGVSHCQDRAARSPSIVTSNLFRSTERLVFQIGQPRRSVGRIAEGLKELMQ